MHFIIQSIERCWILCTFLLHSFWKWSEERKGGQAPRTAEEKDTAACRIITLKRTIGNSTSAWGKEEGGNTQRGNTVRVLKIRSSPEKMNSHGSFPAQEYSRNAELNYQVRASKQKNPKFPVLSAIKIPLNYMVLYQRLGLWKEVSPRACPPLSTLPGVVRPWGLSHKGSQSPTAKTMAQERSSGAALHHEWSSFGFTKPNLTHQVFNRGLKG